MPGEEESSSGEDQLQSNTPVPDAVVQDTSVMPRLRRRFRLAAGFSQPDAFARLIAIILADACYLTRRQQRWMRRLR